VGQNFCYQCDWVDFLDFLVETNQSNIRIEDLVFYKFTTI